MFCLSKGLGAPVGSMLVGTRDFISKAHTERKMLGGGMRQVGVLAAAGLVAIEESPKRLHCDHENAKRLAEALAEMPGIAIDPAKVVTNIVIFDVRAAGKTGAEISVALRERGVLANPTGKTTIRMVTHCDVDRPGIERAIKELANVLRAGESAAASN
jgi:threonine aldolase